MAIDQWQLGDLASFLLTTLLGILIYRKSKLRCCQTSGVSFLKVQGLFLSGKDTFVRKLNKSNGKGTGHKVKTMAHGNKGSG